MMLADLAEVGGSMCATHYQKTKKYIRNELRTSTITEDTNLFFFLTFNPFPFDTDIFSYKKEAK